MNPALIILVTYLFFLLPMLLIMGLILYDGLFQENMSILTRMIEHLPEDDRNIAKTVRNEKRRAFSIFAWTNFTTVNLLAILIYYLAYIKGENDLGLIPQISTIIMVTVGIITSIYFFSALRPSPELAQWIPILESHGVSYKEYDFANLNLKFPNNSRVNKIYILARSYFKLVSPNEHPFFLPPTEYRMFQFTKKLNTQEQKLREMSKLGGSIPSDQISLIPIRLTLKRDLVLSRLWIPRYNKIQTILSVIVMIVGFGTLLILTFLGKDLELKIVWPPNSSTYIMLSTAIGFWGYIWFLLAYFLKELVNHKNIKSILDQNHIMYNPDKDSNDYILKILELIESKFPYQDLQLSSLK